MNAKVIIAVVIVLGFISVAVVIGGIILSSNKLPMPDALIAIGASAVTALAAILPSIRNGRKTSE